MLEDFVRAFWGWTAAEDLLQRDVDDLYGAAASTLAMGRRRRPGEVLVRAYTPTVAADGWRSTRSVLDVVSDDMPFLVDSVVMVAGALDLDVHLHVHPVLSVTRRDGELVDLDGNERESWIHLEIDRFVDEDVRATLDARVRDALAAVDAVVTDWPAMRRACLDAADDVGGEPGELLRWLAADHFTFLGAPGLGLLRTTALDLDELTTDEPVVITKSRYESPVHRAVPMDVVVVGPHRFVGLHTSSTYRKSALDIPVVRQTAQSVLDRAGFTRGTHAGNRLVDIIETFPRDELFQIDAHELYETAIAVLHLRERPRVRLFVRRDRWKRFVSCLVYVPRDRFDTRVRLRLQDALLDAFGGTDLRFTTELGQEAHARLHVVIDTPPGAPSPADVGMLEARLERLTRAWEDELQRALVASLGDDRRFDSWRAAFEPAYQDEVDAALAVEDIVRIDALEAGDVKVALHERAHAAPGELRMRLYRHEPVLLSDALPILAGFGLIVVDERPYVAMPADGPAAWIYDFGLLLPAADALDTATARRRFEEAFLAVWRGHADGDQLGRLVVTAGLAWREVALLRAYRQYLRQAGTPFSQGYLDETLAGNPDVARLLIELFHAGTGGAAVRARIADALTSVASLDEDRILRSMAAAVDATVETSWSRFVAGESDTIAIKLDPHGIPGVPPPVPAHEIFVHAPHVEGVHLRMGRVARGGLRWSDRREDFRTEVLGLVKAQTVKNAVIVPVGAKGGFVCRQLPAGGDRAATQAEVARCYRSFVSALLDVTTDDDPYLVVAADKGTATFSDVANEISLRRGFWLGDAFASGGSTGYDHKAIGITARGAWESVRRHLFQLGIDAEVDPVTAVGIGDMSGDVFGNGMLRSRHLRLVAAFDHRHVFVDPNPDASIAYDERARLFALPSSSWADYDRSLISQGGGVFPRTAKSIDVTVEMAATLDLELGTVTPNELISAILRAEVDVLWNGGIGTYVKASSETNDEVHDRANDAVRIDASRLRCRVVAEGGNLGFTQRARVEAARRGVLLNTDAIDNSAGVDCSDHEVNLKILLDQVVADGELTVTDRNALLAAMTDEVASLVLRNNVNQNLALAAARAQAPGMVDVHLRHLAWLERVARLDRELEALPADEDLLERASAGEGLTQPELAVLLAYTKIELKTELLASDLPDDPTFASELAEYFPSDVRERYAGRLDRHPLRRELIATQLTNQVVDRAGISMVHRVEEETSAAAPDVVRAHIVAWQLFELGELWSELERLRRVVDAQTQIGCILDVRQLNERTTRWVVRSCRAPLDVRSTVAELIEPVTSVMAMLPDAMQVLTERRDVDEARRLVHAGVDETLARRLSLLPFGVAALDIVDLAARREVSLEEVAATYFLLDEQLGLGWLRHRIDLLPRDDRWQALARSALREDFFAEHKRLTDGLLVQDGLPIDLLDRTMRVLAEVRSTPAPGLAQLSVALRELRNLAHQVSGG